MMAQKLHHLPSLSKPHGRCYLGAVLTFVGFHCSESTTLPRARMNVLSKYSCDHAKCYCFATGECCRAACSVTSASSTWKLKSASIPNVTRCCDLFCTTALQAKQQQNQHHLPQKSYRAAAESPAHL